MRLVVKNRPGSRTTVTLMAPTGNRTTETLMERRRTFAYGARRLSTAETGAVATCEISVASAVAETSAVAPCEISVASAVAPLGTSLDCQFVGPTVGEIDLDRYILRSLSSLLPPPPPNLLNPPISAPLKQAPSLPLRYAQFFVAAAPPKSFEPSHLSTAETSDLALRVRHIRPASCSYRAEASFRSIRPNSRHFLFLCQFRGHRQPRVPLG